MGIESDCYCTAKPHVSLPIHVEVLRITNVPENVLENTTVFIP